MPIVIIAIIAFFIGAQPSVRWAKIDDDCSHLTVSRFWGQVVILDGPVCGDEEVTFNGQKLAPDTNDE